MLRAHHFHVSGFMIYIETKELFSPEIDKPDLPTEPDCCSVHMYADIGIKGKEGADHFYFRVITPKFLLEHPEVRWGKGYLLMPEFSWSETERMINRLVLSITANTWDEAARKLSAYIDWEYDNYQPNTPPNL